MCSPCPISCPVPLPTPLTASCCSPYPTLCCPPQLCSPCPPCPDPCRRPCPDPCRRPCPDPCRKPCPDPCSRPCPDPCSKPCPDPCGSGSCCPQKCYKPCNYYAPLPTPKCPKKKIIGGFSCCLPTAPMSCSTPHLPYPANYDCCGLVAPPNLPILPGHPCGTTPCFIPNLRTGPYCPGIDDFSDKCGSCAYCCE